MKLITLFLFLFVFQLIFCQYEKTSKIRLIEVNKIRKWMKEEEIQNLSNKLEKINTRYIDVTDTQNLEINPIIEPKYTYPNQPSQQEIMKKLLPNVSQQLLTERITHLSENFDSRHCTRPGGKVSAEWIKSQYELIIKSLSPERQQLFTTEFLETTGRPQPSVIIRMKGSINQLVIMGAHEDSTTHSRTVKEPGADDNASGSATVMEAFRVIAKSDFIPKRTLEFHHYACEETGLLGSRQTAQKYKNGNVQIYANANIDMTGYHPRGNPGIGLILDYTSTELNTFFLKIIKEYSHVEAKTYRCGYACGDHYSWYVAGYRQLTYPQEVNNFSNLNPAYHTDRDRINMFNMTRATEFVKFTIGFAIELSNAI